MFRKKEAVPTISVGDRVKIVGHKYFPKTDILPIGAVFTVEEIDEVTNSVVYEWSKEPRITWWIVPGDYEIIKEE